MLRKSGNKRYIELVHDVWTRHLFDKLPFEQYGNFFEKTTSKPYFLTIDTSSFQL